MTIWFYNSNSHPASGHIYIYLAQSIIDRAFRLYCIPGLAEKPWPSGALKYASGKIDAQNLPRTCPGTFNTLSNDFMCRIFVLYYFDTDQQNQLDHCRIERDTVLNLIGYSCEGKLGECKNSGSSKYPLVGSTAFAASSPSVGQLPHLA